MFSISKNVLKQALDLSPVATVIVDTSGSVSQVAYVNQAFEAVSGYDGGELIGHPWRDFVAADDEAGMENLVEEVVDVLDALLGRDVEHLFALQKLIDGQADQESGLSLIHI